MAHLGHESSCFLYVVSASKNCSDETLLNVTTISIKALKAGSLRIESYTHYLIVKFTCSPVTKIQISSISSNRSSISIMLSWCNFIAYHNIRGLSQKVVDFLFYKKTIQCIAIEFYL